MACLVLGCARPADLALFNADACLVGEELDVAGESVAAGGDVDGDGLCDLLVGAPYHDEVVDRVGAAYLVLGNAAPADASLAAADARYLGVDADDWAGTSIAGLGDVDGDGFGDLLVGVPHDDSTAERAGMAAYLRGGPAILGVLDVAATLRLQGSSAGDEAGSAVAAAGDFDGDGVPDALVGAPGAEGGAGTGAAYLVLGATLF
jgi:hypothetical protein